MIQLRGLTALILFTCLSSGVFAADTAVTYDQARWDPIHFKPAIDAASNEQCLACHREIMERRVLEVSPAGVTAQQTIAWYQTLDTYAGDQETFHRRHLVTDYADRVMQLQCNTCHQGNDPREDTANSSATGQTGLVQRKQVDPRIGLMCPGQFNYQVMGVPGSWTEHGKVFGDSCLTCHVAIRTTRHQVNFLKPEAIEEAGKQNNDVCYGCHGGRSWYRIHYPYPRHAWPGSGATVPDWARDRPTQSDPRFAVTATSAAAQ